jgi:hypothetical protein
LIDKVKKLDSKVESIISEKNLQANWP